MAAGALGAHLLRERLLDASQVEQFGRLLDGGGRARALCVQQFSNIDLVTLPHRLKQLAGTLLILLHCAVPHRIELLELDHVRLLDAEALGYLP